MCTLFFILQTPWLIICHSDVFVVYFVIVVLAFCYNYALYIYILQTPSLTRSCLDVLAVYFVIVTTDFAIFYFMPYYIILYFMLWLIRCHSDVTFVYPPPPPPPQVMAYMYTVYLIDHKHLG